MSTSQQEANELGRLEARVSVLERQVQTLAVAADAASRLRLSSEGADPYVHVVGGEWVRHILAKGGLIADSEELGGQE